VQPALDALVRLGLAVEPVLEAAELSPAALASPEARITAERAWRLWDAAAAAAGDEAFGAHVAEQKPEDDLFGFLLSTSKTLGQGYARIGEFVRLYYDHGRLELSCAGGIAKLARTPQSPRGATSRQYVEYTVALLVARGRTASGLDWPPIEVRFAHAESSSEPELQRFFRCPIVFGALRDEFCFDAELCERPLVAANAPLNAILSRYASDLLRRLPSEGDLLESVRRQIARDLAAGEISVEHLARQLRMSARTLQRRLRALGTSHHALVDELRRSLAEKYLRDPRLGLSEISYLLRFSDASAFHRAFKRWTGQTPACYRQHPSQL
jgi:AraC-like DNA-binding protein